VYRLNTIQKQYDGKKFGEITFLYNIVFSSGVPGHWLGLCNECANFGFNDKSYCLRLKMILSGVWYYVYFLVDIAD